MHRKWYRKFSCTFLYIALIVVINNVFAYAPYITVHGSLVSSVDIIVGVVYILRDFVQREIKHYVIIAMLIGCFLSYLLADKQIAIASVTAFFVGELIDWAIYTFSKKPFSERLLWSAGVSAPIDSAIFLYLTSLLNIFGLTALTLGKLLGILAVWYSWRRKQLQTNLALAPSI